MQNPGRNCTGCMGLRRLTVEARFVATDAEGLQWYECGEHEPSDNVASVLRVSLTPIDEWFASLRGNLDTYLDGVVDALIGGLPDAVIDAMMAAILPPPRATTWCLSFADADGFEGGCFVEVEATSEAAGMVAAVERARSLGIERGDDALGVRLTPEDAARVRPYLNRLLTLAEMEAAAGEPCGLMAVDTLENGEAVATFDGVTHPVRTVP